VRLSLQLVAEPVSQAEELEREADAVDRARIDAGIAPVTGAVNRQPSNWRRLREWGTSAKNSLHGKVNACCSL